MADLAGINLAMQTPFEADGSINFDEWKRLIDVYIDAGAHGLVMGSGTGQHPYLTEKECNELYEVGIKRIDGLLEDWDEGRTARQDGNSSPGKGRRGKEGR